MKKSISFMDVGNTTVQFSSDKFDGEILDTRIEIGKETLCWIAGCEIQNFKRELTELVEKYKI